MPLLCCLRWQRKVLFLFVPHGTQGFTSSVGFLPNELSGQIIFQDFHVLSCPVLSGFTILPLPIRWFFLFLCAYISDRSVCRTLRRRRPMSLRLAWAVPLRPNLPCRRGRDPIYLLLIVFDFSISMRLAPGALPFPALPCLSTEPLIRTGVVGNF